MQVVLMVKRCSDRKFKSRFVYKRHSPRNFIFKGTVLDASM